MNNTPSRLAREAARRRRLAPAPGQPFPAQTRPATAKPPQPAKQPLATPYDPVVTPMYQTMSGGATPNQTARPGQAAAPPQKHPAPSPATAPPLYPPRQAAPSPPQKAAPAPPASVRAPVHPSAMPPSSKSATSVFHPAVEAPQQRTAYQDLMRKHDQMAVLRRQADTPRPAPKRPAPDKAASEADAPPEATRTVE